MQEATRNSVEPVAQHFSSWGTGSTWGQHPWQWRLCGPGLVTFPWLLCWQRLFERLGSGPWNEPPESPSLRWKWLTSDKLDEVQPNLKIISYIYIYLLNIWKYSLIETYLEWNICLRWRKDCSLDAIWWVFPWQENGEICEMFREAGEQGEPVQQVQQVHRNHRNVCNADPVACWVAVRLPVKIISRNLVASACSFWTLTGFYIHWRLGAIHRLVAKHCAELLQWFQQDSISLNQATTCCHMLYDSIDFWTLGLVPALGEVRLMGQKVDTTHCFEPSCMEELCRITKQSGADLVVTSSWRQHLGLVNLIQFIQLWFRSLKCW